MTPYDEAAEQAAVACCMVDSRAAETVIEMLRPDDLFRPIPRTLFREISAMASEGQPLDEIALHARLRAKNMDYRVELGQWMMTATAANVEQYCGIVREMAEKRAIFNLSQTLAQKVGTGVSCDEALAYVQAELDAINSRRLNIASDPEDLQDAAEKVAHDALTLPPCNDGCFGLRTGVPGFDGLTGGIQCSQLWVLAGLASMGKSTLINRICRGVVAMNEGAGHPLIFSTEMPARAVARNALASAAGVHSRGIMQRNLTEHQQERVREAIESKALSGIKVQYAGGMKLPQVRAIAKRHKRKHGLPLMIVDMASGLDSGQSNPKDHIDAVTVFLKNLKVELDTCIIACAHFNRSVFANNQAGASKAEARRPELHQLRDSGNIENHADKVILLHRPGYHGDKTDPRTEIICAKDRDGNTGSIWVVWDRDTSEYRLAQEDNV